MDGLRSKERGTALLQDEATDSGTTLEGRAIRTSESILWVAFLLVPLLFRKNPSAEVLAFASFAGAGAGFWVRHRIGASRRFRADVSGIVVTGRDGKETRIAWNEVACFESLELEQASYLRIHAQGGGAVRAFTIGLLYGSEPIERFIEHSAQLARGAGVEPAVGPILTIHDHQFRTLLVRRLAIWGACAGTCWLLAQGVAGIAPAVVWLFSALAMSLVAGLGFRGFRRSRRVTVDGDIGRLPKSWRKWASALRQGEKSPP